MNYCGIYINDKLQDNINFENKARFLLDKSKEGIWDTSLHTYTSVFLKIQDCENHFKSDILDMSKYKIASIFEMVINSFANYSSACSVLGMYFKFYGKDFDSVKPNFEDLEIQNNYNNKYIRDYSMLCDLINKAFSCNDECIDIFKALTIKLSYIGFKKSEIPLIKKSEVNYSNNSISCDDHIIHNIPIDCMELCKLCANTTEIYLTSSIQKSLKDRKYLPLYNNEYLIRARKQDYWLDDQPCQSSWLNRAMQQLNNNTNGQYSFDTIRYSGLFSWLYNKELKGEFDPNQSRRKLEKIYLEYFQSPCSASSSSRNYKIWKQIFYGY